PENLAKRVLQRRIEREQALLPSLRDHVSTIRPLVGACDQVLLRRKRLALRQRRRADSARERQLERLRRLQPLSLHEPIARGGVGELLVANLAAGRRNWILRARDRCRGDEQAKPQRPPCRANGCFLESAQSCPRKKRTSSYRRPSWGQFRVQVRE